MSAPQSDPSDPAGQGSGAPASASRAALRITVELDRQTAEALRLELRRLARGYGVDPDAIRFETAPGRARPVP